MLAACREVAEGKLDGEFPVDVFQTGSGTSSNMNCNEVIANRAIELMGGDRFSPEKPIHPNDHVNMGQSTNDTFPTAIHVAVAQRDQERSAPCPATTGRHADPESEGLGPGHQDRPHPPDGCHSAATGPGSWRLCPPAAVVRPAGEQALKRCSNCRSAARPSGRESTRIRNLAAASPPCWPRKPEFLSSRRTIILKPTPSAMRWSTATARCGRLPRRCSTWPITSAGSAPVLVAGSTKSNLPSRQPGSSIMPGKVNPVMCESMMQVAARVIGNDQTVTVSGAAGGQFQLNIMMPVMGQTTLESVQLLAAATRAFVDFCAAEMEANVEACAAAVEKSLSMVTSLNPLIGYEKAAKLAKEAFETGKTIRESVPRTRHFAEKTLQEALDPMRMTEPQE